MKLKQIIFVIIVLFTASCANRVVPVGGDKDVLPPKFISSEPPPGTVNFKGKEIEIKFDEYVQLKDLPTQLLVSPLMDPKPEVKAGKRSIIITLPEKLKSNTTYTIAFGKAIADLHEGNALENFQYVFSTGPVLDSLKCYGTVKDALTLTPLKDITVMLYRIDDSLTTPDSLIFHLKPDYFSHSTESGSFIIRNIAEGNYKLFALEDKNNNYILDNLKDERMAFSTKNISIPQLDTLNLLLSLQHPFKKQFLKSQVNDRLRTALIFNQSIDTLTVRELVSGKNYSGLMEWTSKRDSLFLFAKDTLTDSLHLIIYSEPSINDTLQIQLMATTVKRRSGIPSLKVDKAVLPSAPGQFSFLLEFSRPIGKINFNYQLIQDSLKISFSSYSILKDSSSSRRAFLNLNWKDGSDYKLVLPAGTFTDSYGLSNDSIEYHFKIPSVETTASVIVHVKEIQQPGNYLLQLLNDKYEVIMQRNISDNGAYEFNYIPPSTYSFRIVNDLNKNAELDAADYLKKLQPEPVTISNPVQLRANWELEIDVSGKFIY